MGFKVLVFLSVVTFVCAGNSPNGVSYLASVDADEIDPDVAEDALLDFVGLVTKYKYPVETHTIQTEDGYLLTVHRIPGTKGEQIKQGQKQNKPVILLMHGLLCSSADWIFMGPDSGLGYYLADKGFDVWLGNARGTYYSRKHISLDADRHSKYWKFSWNEIGYYDLPAMIDYILAETGKTKLHYAGHSQGTTTFFVMGSSRQEYNHKILSMQALAPVGYMSHAKSPLVKAMAPIANTVEVLTSFIGINEFLPSSDLMTFAANLLCKDNSAFQPVCTSILFLLCGFNPELLNNTMLPVILSHTPAGSSSKQVVHYGQEHLSAKFRQYDHGLIGNLVEYGSVSPPKYSMSDVTAPVALHYADNDWLTDTVDVDQLYRELGNPIGKFRVPNDKFNHLDYLWATGVRTLLYDRMINLMNAYDEN